MKPVHFLIIMTSLFTLLGLGAAKSSTSDDRHLLDHEVRKLDSDERVNLRQAYDGKVVLVVNTASKCAFTDQYGGLEDLHARYRDRGLVVLGFPSNDFGAQEPGSERQISDFCRLTYSVKFPMFAKTSVRKGKADPFFEGLAEAAGRYPKWNFHKYLVGRDGKIVDDFLSFTAPDSKILLEAIERAL